MYVYQGLKVESLVAMYVYTGEVVVARDSKLSPLSLCMCIQGEVADTLVCLYFTRDSKLSPLSLCMCIQEQVVDTLVCLSLPS